MMMMIQETLAKEEAENQKKALELRDLQVGIKCSPIITHINHYHRFCISIGDFFLGGVSNAGPKIRSGLNLCGSIYLTKSGNQADSNLLDM